MKVGQLEKVVKFQEDAVNKQKIVILSLAFMIVLLVALSLSMRPKVSTVGEVIDVTYTLEYEENMHDQTYDWMTHKILVTNLTNKDLRNFNIHIEFDDKMKDFTPLPKFLTKPVTLKAKQEGSLNHVMEYSKKSLVFKPDKLTKEQYETFHEIFDQLRLDITWRGGQMELLLDKNDLEEIPNLLLR